MKYRAQYDYSPEGVVEALRRGLGYDVREGKAVRRDMPAVVEHPHDTAAKRVEAAFATLNVPGVVKVEYVDSRRREGALDDGEVHAMDNDFDIDVRIAMRSGGTVYARVPIAKRAGRFLSPSTIYVANQPYLLTQSTIDSLFAPSRHLGPRMAQSKSKSK